MAIERLEINDECPHCKESNVQYVGENVPYSTEHLWCKRCNSTFTYDKFRPEKLKYMEEVNSGVCDILDNMQEKMMLMYGEKFEITNKQEDKIFDILQEILEDYSITGDYRNHN